MAESDEELKSLLMKMKQENEKAGLKLNIKKTKIMASGPIILWPKNKKKTFGEKWKQWKIFLGSKITADGDCSVEIKKLDPWKESYDKPRQCIKK